MVMEISKVMPRIEMVITKKGNRKMAIRALNLGHGIRNDQNLSVLPDRIIFSSKFINSNGLEKYEYTTFLIDDDDPYFLGFNFHSERTEGALKIQTQTRNGKVSGTRIVKTAGLYRLHPIANRVSKSNKPSDRVFSITKDINENFYKIFFRPVFENSTDFNDRNLIPSGLGIYRYFDANGQLLYIGKGNIKERANQQDRKDWGIQKIEYSLLKTEEEAFEWESFYINKYEEENGVIPTFNRIRGRSEKN